VRKYTAGKNEKTRAGSCSHEALNSPPQNENTKKY
jgi:hypothetical protein